MNPAAGYAPEQQQQQQYGVMGPPAPPGQQAVRPPNPLTRQQPVPPQPQMQHPSGMPQPGQHMGPAPHQMTPPGQYRQPLHPGDQRLAPPGPPGGQLPPPPPQMGSMSQQQQQQPPPGMGPMQHMSQPQQGQAMPHRPPLGPPAGYGMNQQPQQQHHQQMAPHPGQHPGPPPGSSPYGVPPGRPMGPPPPPPGHQSSPMSRPPRPPQMGPGPGMPAGAGMSSPGGVPAGMQQRPGMPLSGPRPLQPGYGQHPGMGPGVMASGPGMDRSGGPPKKKKKLADKILPQKVRDLVPESQAYMDLLSFERKLDFTITRKRLDIQEALKRPMKHKRKLRVFISNTFFPARPEGDGAAEGAVPMWELRVEGRLIDDAAAPRIDQSKGKRKFSSFFKSLVIELDQELYGPDNHLVEWHRTQNTQETDGFQVKRPGDKNVKCTILLMLDYQPHQYRLDARLARLLGIHTQTRPVIINALWQYMKSHKLQDAHEREYVNLDKYLEQIFGTARLKFAEIPSRLNSLIHPPDPIQINHLISMGPAAAGGELKKTSCYDIDVEIEDPLKAHMSNFVMSSTNQQEITQLDNKIHETVDTISQLKTNREFFLSFCKDPQQFIVKWLMSQNRDLKVMTDVAGNPEEERRSDFFYQPWTQEGVCRYFYSKVQLRRAEIEQALGIRNA